MARLHRGNHTFQQDTFMSGMLVDQVHATILALGHNIALCYLPNDAQTWQATRLMWINLLTLRKLARRGRVLWQPAIIPSWQHAPPLICLRAIIHVSRIGSRLGFAPLMN